MKADLLALGPEIGFVLLERDIDQNGEHTEPNERLTMERYRDLLPVLDIEHGEILYSPFSYDDLFDAIDKAVARSRQS